MAEFATIFLSPFLQVFFKRMASGEFVDFFRQQKLCISAFTVHTSVTKSDSLFPILVPMSNLVGPRLQIRGWENQTLSTSMDIQLSQNKKINGSLYPSFCLLLFLILPLTNLHFSGHYHSVRDLFKSTHIPHEDEAKQPDKDS
jgi:hypothetical protein